MKTRVRNIRDLKAANPSELPFASLSRRPHKGTLVWRPVLGRQLARVCLRPLLLLGPASAAGCSGDTETRHNICVYETATCHDASYDIVGDLVINSPSTCPPAEAEFEAACIDIFSVERCPELGNETDSLDGTTYHTTRRSAHVVTGMSCADWEVAGSPFDAAETTVGPATTPPTGQTTSTPPPVAPQTSAQCYNGESYCLDTTTANSCSDGSWDTIDCHELCQDWGIDSGVCDSSSGSCRCDGDFLDLDCALGTLALCECVTDGCTDSEFANVYLNCFHNADDARSTITCLGPYATLDENDELFVDCELAVAYCLQEPPMEQ